MIEEWLDYLEKEWSEDRILEAVDEQMPEYVDDYTLEEWDGDVYEAYCEIGGGEAEGDVFMMIIKDLKDQGIEFDEETVRDYLNELTGLRF